MRKRHLWSMTAIAIVGGLAFLGASSGVFEDSANWPGWRGPDASGAATDAQPPIRWSESENIRWKTAIPGKGKSTPVIWGDMLFVTSAVPVEGAVVTASEDAAPSSSGRRRRRGVQPTVPLKFTLFALNRSTGKILWKRVANELVPHEGTHRDGSWASPSPATDGEVVIAHFGSYGISAYDMKGKRLWKNDLGNMRTRNGFGEGSSPALHGDRLVINWDHEGDSFIVCMDKRTGKTLWRADRDEVTSWSTPLILERGGRTHVIVSATSRVRSYDLEDGKVIWESGGMTVNTIPSPVALDDIVIVMSGFRGNALQAIQLSKAKGDVREAGALIWEHGSDTPYVPSPLLFGEKLYFLKSNNGILSCFNVKTGKEYFSRQRIDGIQNIYASPVGANGHVYLTGRDGTTVVISDRDAYEVVATNKLDDGIDASAAIVGDAIYLRGENHLYCIADGK